MAIDAFNYYMLNYYMYFVLYKNSRAMSHVVRVSQACSVIMHAKVKLAQQACAKPFSQLDIYIELFQQISDMSNVV